MQCCAVLCYMLYYAVSLGAVGAVVSTMEPHTPPWLCGNRDAIVQTQRVQMYPLCQRGAADGLKPSLFVLDYPGLTGDQAFRDEAIHCQFLANVIIVVLDAQKVDVDARDAVRKALATCGVTKEQKKNVRARRHRLSPSPVVLGVSPQFAFPH